MLLLLVKYCFVRDLKKINFNKIMGDKINETCLEDKRLVPGLAKRDETRHSVLEERCGV